MIPIASLMSCGEDFLDRKPNKSIVVPTTLDELQALLDNSRVMNVAPGIGVLGADNIFMEEDGWEGLINPLERNGYLWARDVFEGQQSCSDWTVPYEQIFYANAVLEQLENVNVSTAEEVRWQQIRGRALFYRAFAFYELAQLFCAPYHPDAFNGPGIPLRLTADINAPITRATIQETYDRIVQDLEDAVKLLPVLPEVKTRPAQGTAHALLARVFLAMEDYERAEHHAGKALEINATLVDYNTLNAEAARPFTTFHDEVVFHSSMVTYRYLNSALTYIVPDLMASYDTDDLRRLVFFQDRGNGRYTFKGSYTGNLTKFGGISNNEVYLIRAECRVRNGDVEGALEYLNALLEKRWLTGTFIPVAEDDPEVLLEIVLLERRKELVYRSLRWTDLRRLNRDVRFATTLTRTLDATEYSIGPGDPRYVYPIPFQEISLSGIAQNER